MTASLRRGFYRALDKKKQSSRGFTIIEVMLALGISGVLFTAGVLVFQGQQGKTVLSQSLYDLASKIQSYGAQVNAGVYPDSSSYSCAIGSDNRPTLSYSAGGTTQTGSQQDCLFLGRALQVITDSPQLLSYTVLGTRDYYINGRDSGSAAQSFDQANPTPAIANNWGLSDTYTLPPGETFTSSRIIDQAGNSYSNYDLVGLYIDLSGSARTTSLSIRGYNFSDTVGKSTGVENCIEQAGTCGSYIPTRSWHLCVNSGSLNGTVIITTTPSGVGTTVDAQECI